MIDPATGWFELKEISSKSADNVANVVEQTWLTWYPRPSVITYDRGGEFMAEFAKMVQDNYRIKCRPITTRNPQANAIIECVHQTIGNMLRTFEVHKQELDDENLWGGILAAIMYAAHAAVHMTTYAIPIQLVFGHDANLNIQFEADWQSIRQNK